MGRALVLSQKVFHKHASPKPALVFAQVFRSASPKPVFFDVLTCDRPNGVVFEPCKHNISIFEKKGNRALFLSHDRHVPNYKYVIGRTIGWKRAMAIMPMTRIDRHRDIVNYARKELGMRIYMIRGGLMVISEGRIQIFGKSDQYGRANHAEAASILREFLGEDSGFKFSCRQWL
jgi:hypothetical protein